MSRLLLYPCDEAWDGMTPTREGRFCGRCGVDVLDATDHSPERLAARVPPGRRVCLRVRRDQVAVATSPFRTCPGRPARIVAWTALAAAALPACSAERHRPHYGLPDPTVAGCESPPRDPWAPAYGARSDEPPVALCDVAPDARACGPASLPPPAHDAAGSRLAQHLRPDCSELPSRQSGLWVGAAIVTSVRTERTDENPLPPRDDVDFRTWPDGLDVFVAQMTVDGLPWESARAAVRRALEPLGRCYAAAVSRRPEDPPQGQLLASLSLDPDGRVASLDAEPRGLPPEVVACAEAELRGAQLGSVDADYAVVVLDVRFVYRPPFRP